MENPKSKENHPLLSLQEKLTSAKIDTSTWGKGQAKTLQHLQREIDDGEAIIIKKENGTLLRQVEGGGSDVYYTSPTGKKYKLREDKQVFNDGRERRRHIGQAVSEKMKQSENPIDAMIRGIKEELGIGGEINLTALDIVEETKDSQSYPGLRSTYIHHKFKTVLTEPQFNPDGYIEEQTDKSTYFVWVELGEE